MKRTVKPTTPLLIAMLTLAVAVPAGANHKYGTYPSLNGWRQFARSSNNAVLHGWSWLVSRNSDGSYNFQYACPTGLKTGLDRVRTTTAGQTDPTTFNARWPSGIRLIHDDTNCNGQFTPAGNDWVFLFFNSAEAFCHPDPNVNTSACRQNPAGGRIHRSKASKKTCAFYTSPGNTPPESCGYVSAVIEIAKISTKWDRSGYDKIREVLHETGHAVGLNHHCSGDSISNNGSEVPDGSGKPCNGYRWSAVTGYQPRDRQTVVDIYPAPWPRPF